MKKAQIGQVVTVLLTSLNLHISRGLTASSKCCGNTPTSPQRTWRTFLMAGLLKQYAKHVRDMGAITPMRFLFAKSATSTLSMLQLLGRPDSAFAASASSRKRHGESSTPRRLSGRRMRSDNVASKPDTSVSSASYSRHEDKTVDKHEARSLRAGTPER